MSVATLSTLLLSATVLLLFRSGAVAMRPAMLASLIALATLLAAITLALAIGRKSVAGALVCGGLLLVLGGGLANWLFSLQGFVILSELEAVPLHGGAHLQGFDTGLLSNVEEMALTLQLEKLELVRAGAGFLPVSRLRLIEAGRSPHLLEIARGKAASLRTLRFHQGAFGYAPRIVITRNGDTVFDRHVPFTTRPRGENELSFDGAFDVQEQRLSVRGGVRLDTLDDDMNGHPRLGLVVQRDGKPFGAGELSVGHFARLGDGYAIGFAGLRKWSEIDIARRNYPQPIFAGVALMFAGALLWAFRRRAR